MHNLDEINIQCPYCGVQVSVLVDCSVEEQTYIEDCEVCCRPMDIHVKTDDLGVAHVTVCHENNVTSGFYNSAI